MEGDQGALLELSYFAGILYTPGEFNSKLVCFFTGVRQAAIA